MQLKDLLLTAVITASLLPGASVAGTDSGFYVGAGVGQSSVDDLEGDFGNVSFDADDTGWKVFGGFNFGWIPFLDLAVEAGYVDFGTLDDEVGGTRIEIDGDGFDVFGLVGTNLGPIGVFAKAGLVNWDADLDSSLGSASDDGTDPAYGIGARLKFGSLEARAEFEYFDVDAVEDASLISASAVWTF